LNFARIPHEKLIGNWFGRFKKRELILIHYIENYKETTNHSILKKLKSLLLLPLIFAGCTVEIDIPIESNLPVVSTKEVIAISRTGAISGGIISDDLGLTVISRGVCWSEQIDPTVEDNKSDDGPGAGSFNVDISGLEQFKTYYVRAYATNASGTAYGSTLSFTTQETYTDLRDGKKYQTIIIGNQEWMAENLSYEPEEGKFWAYGNDEGFIESYGLLYNWTTAREVCPQGWHLPEIDEFEQLIDTLGGLNVAGGKMKNLTGWNPPNTGATNSSGFTGLPGGAFYPNFNSLFDYEGNSGFWWTSTENTNPSSGVSIQLDYNRASVIKGAQLKTRGFSCRCIRN
jgi:uncharacterized protein (TIGR02145 family)